MSRSSCPVHTPLNKNGLFERKHHHSADVAHTPLVTTKPPPPFHLRLEAVSTTMSLINRLPTPLLKQFSQYSRIILTHYPSHSSIIMPNGTLLRIRLRMSCEQAQN